ncbi:hypothetical protein Cni_G24045 [Canna indica]|uniref:Uncharacterized protein n=1 Tax=Canna indica TaxID=4628 RepID=A0AAQ3KUZ6_9LILI|nr:hypothetical protein Cni_G24045 [Canna indica]
MPFQMKIQPIDANGAVAFVSMTDPAKPVAKSRLKRLLERQFPSVLKISSADKVIGCGDGREKERDDGGEVEPSSCLDTMVFGFTEEVNHEKLPRRRCNCFNANFDDSSDDEFDTRDGDSPGAVTAPIDAVEAIKGLVLCASVAERNLLADASKILDKAKTSKNKGDCRKTVTDGLRSLGYNAAICKSRWDKNPSFPAGEYEYVDVVIDGGDRFLLDVDFRSEFEVARASRTYRAVLQQLPQVFVGRPDRLQQIVAVASEAARQSLKKKGLHVPPWRRAEYMKAKWLSPYQRTTAMEEAKEESVSGGAKKIGIAIPYSISAVDFTGASEESSVGVMTDDISNAAAAAEEKIKVVVSPWQPAPARPKPGVTGLALVL